VIPPQISILIPHLRNPANDSALRVCLDCIVANTGLDYELVIEAIAPRDDVYDICNHMAEIALADWVVFGNSDVFFAPGWAEAMYAQRAPDAIVTDVLVECGVIDVSDRNVHMDFGRTPAEFRRADFETWAAQDTADRGGAGWFFPSLHHRDTFLTWGGFDRSRGVYPEPLDEYYWDKWLADGNRVIRARSYAYHLQRWADRGTG
jgi:hypothetical protein